MGTGASQVAVGNHTHDASAITGGTMNIARLPVGTAAGTVAAGNHTHPANWKVTNALPYTRGNLPWNGSFSCSAGSTILLHATATAYRGAAGLMQINVLVDGVVRDAMYGYTNEASSHKTLNPVTLVLTGLAAGNHTVQLAIASGSATTDQNDFAQVIVHELIP